MAMAWGYKPRDYGPHRVQAIFATNGAVDRIRAIVEMTRSDGAAAAGQTMDWLAARG
jgi:hypothetical protein